MQYMNIARVTKVFEKPHAWKTGETTMALSASVQRSSGYMMGPYNVTLTVLDRVVKLNPDPPPAPTVELNCTSATTQLAASVRSRYSSAALRTSARIGFTS